MRRNGFFWLAAPCHTTDVVTIRNIAKAAAEALTGKTGLDKATFCALDILLHEGTTERVQE